MSSSGSSRRTRRATSRPRLAERWQLEEDGPRRPAAASARTSVFSDGAPVSAAAVKASLERSIRLSRDQMPAAFVAIRGIAEYLKGRGAGGRRHRRGR